MLHHNKLFYGLHDKPKTLHYINTNLVQVMDFLIRHFNPYLYYRGNTC
jgi:hypothetical protein